MSTLTFKSISISNFMGFGSDETIIDLSNPGLLLVTGNNGSGKSSLILESISFALYGIPYRKIKITELINRNNKRKLLVSITFEINNNVYVLTRGIKPNILTLTCNDEDLDMLSSKALTQDEIDKIIGINKDMFKNIIALSISFNKPFLTLPSADKRLYIENVFNISIFSQMLLLIKKENSTLKINDNINSKAISIMESNILSLRSNLKNIKNTISSFEDTKKKEKESISSCIETIDKKIKTFTIIINSFNKDFSPNDKLLKEFESNIMSNKIELKSAKESLKFYTNNTTCPSCDTIIDEVKRKEHISSYTDKIEMFERDIESRSKVIDHMKEVLRKYNEDLITYTSALREVEYLKKERLSYENRSKDVDNRALEHIDLKNLNDDLKGKTDEYTTLYSTNISEKESLRINNIIQAILQDDGIKTFFIQQLLPLLNERVNYYLTEFNMPLVFTFNERLEESLKSLNHYDNDISYLSHSEGEKKKIDIAILFSFIDLTKKISNWSCNLLVIDELLDSAVDATSLDQILDCIKNIASEDKNLGIYIISHREIDTSYFDHKIQIEKHNNFSTIKQDTK